MQLTPIQPIQSWTIAMNNSAEAKDLPKFYSRRCKPLLEQFIIAQGYIDENDIRKPRK